MRTPEPDSSCERVFPGDGGLTASILTTAGITRRAADSKRSLSRISWPSAPAAGGAAGLSANTLGVIRGRTASPTAPPTNAQPPKKNRNPTRFSMMEPHPRYGRCGEPNRRRLKCKRRSLVKLEPEWGFSEVFCCRRRHKAKKARIFSRCGLLPCCKIRHAVATCGAHRAACGVTPERHAANGQGLLRQVHLQP